MGVNLFASLRQKLVPPKILLLILIVGLLHGLLYYVIIPPWWHYDEPGHFEYAWLAANQPGWPKAGEYDAAMRREMAKSMQRYGWYSFRNYYPKFNSNQPIWIGATQTGDEPAYYFLISLPLRLLHNTDITVQYEVARFVSLILFLLILLVIWKAMGEVVSDGHPLQGIVTGFAALLPAFVDEMVSVNNDVAAVLVSSLFLWASLRLIRQGFSIRRVVFLAFTLVLCYLTKTTAWYAFLVAPLVLIFSLLHGRYAWLVWTVTAAGLAAGALLTLEGGNPAAWYQSLPQTPPLRLQAEQAPLGKYVFQIDYSGGRAPDQTGQFLNLQLVKSLRGKTVTLGLWAWSNQALQANGPSIRFVTTSTRFINQAYGLTELGPQPVFLQQTFEVPADANYAILIPPYPHGLPPSASPRIFFDGVVLAEGQYNQVAPQFSDAQGTQGNWGGVAFQNLVRNGSAEEGNLRVRPWMTKITSKLPFVGDIGFYVTTLEDWQGTGWYYQGVVLALLLNFWSFLAGGHLGLPGNYSDNFLILLTVLGILGSCLLLWRRRHQLPWDLIYILGLSLMLGWVAAGVRGIYSLLMADLLYPWSRYAYPVLLPTALLICAGWLEWIRLAGRWIHLSETAARLAPVAIMTGLTLFTVIDIIGYFQPTSTSLGFLILLVGLQYLALQGILWGSRKMRVSAPAEIADSTSTHHDDKRK